MSENENLIPEEPKRDTATAADAASPTYLMVVGGLLVLIIAMLAVLWMRERSRRVTAEKDLMELVERNQKMAGLFSQMMAGGPKGLMGHEEPVRAVSREDLPRKTIALDGKSVQALSVSAAAGERFGFAPGDVVLVAEGELGARLRSVSRPASTAESPSSMPGN